MVRHRAVCLAALVGCARTGVDTRVAMFREVPAKLPTCAGDRPTIGVESALAASWQPGDRMVVRGFLTATAYGPPCEGHQPPGAGNHCTTVWVLSDRPSHPTEVEDALPGYLLRLKA